MGLARLKNYDMLDLSDPKTYSADPWLLNTANLIASQCYEAIAAESMDLQEFRKRILAGEYPELVLAVAKQYEIGTQASNNE